MENLAAKWGKFLGLSYETEYVKDIEIAMIMIETSQIQDIDELVNIVYGGKIFKVKVSDE